MLIVLVCMSAVAPIAHSLSSSTAEYSWLCTGLLSSLAYADCQGSFYNTTGCYFKVHFSQYRPCSGVCNDVVVNSIDEEKCNAYCPDYLSAHCQIESSDDIHYSGPLTQQNTVTNAFDHGRSAKGQIKKSTIAVIVCIGVTILIMIIVSAVIIWKNNGFSGRKKSTHRQTGLEESDGMLELNASENVDTTPIVHPDGENEQSCTGIKEPGILLYSCRSNGMTTSSVAYQDEENDEKLVKSNWTQGNN